MRSPWGDLAVSDAHVHFFSHRFFSALAKQKGCSTEEAVGHLGWTVPHTDPVELARAWAGELDKNGVAHGVLIASDPGDYPSVLAAGRAFPDRFRGFFLCDPTSADALSNAEAALDGGMSGICLFPAMHRYSMRSGQAEAVVQLAAGRPGTIVFVHCGVLSIGVRRKLSLPSRFDMSFSNPIDLHGVALKYPAVNFIVPHFGAGFFREALMLCDLCPNVYLDTSSTNCWRRYLSPVPTLMQVFEQALSIAGEERLLFGTDSSFFPRGWVHAVYEEQCTALHEAGVSAQTAQKIFGGNLRKLLRLS